MSERSSAETLPSGPGYALIELRRSAFRFVDLKGRVAEILAGAYDSVTFASPGLSYLEKLEVLTSAGRRKGFASAHHIGFEDTEPDDALQFASQAMTFIRRVEKELNIKTYERIGVRCFFDIELDEIVDAARMTLDWEPRHGAELSQFAVRFSDVVDDWLVNIRVESMNQAGQEAPGQYVGRVRFDVDQYQSQVASADALNLDVPGAFDRARQQVLRFMG